MNQTFPLPTLKVPLGVTARDTLSGASGIVTSTVFKLSGSVMTSIAPKGDGTTVPETWSFDEQSVEVVPDGPTAVVTPSGDPLVALGMDVEDKLTKFRGHVTAIVLHINGCISVVLTRSKLDKDGKVVEEYFDHGRLTIKGQGLSSVVLDKAKPAKAAAEPKRTGGFIQRARPSC